MAKLSQGMTNLTDDNHLKKHHISAHDQNCTQQAHYFNRQHSSNWLAFLYYTSKSSLELYIYMCKCMCDTPDSRITLRIYYLTFHYCCMFWPTPTGGGSDRQMNILTSKWSMIILVTKKPAIRQDYLFHFKCTQTRWSNTGVVTILSSAHINQKLRAVHIQVANTTYQNKEEEEQTSQSLANTK